MERIRRVAACGLFSALCRQMDSKSFSASAVRLNFITGYALLLSLTLMLKLPPGFLYNVVKIQEAISSPAQSGEAVFSRLEAKYQAMLEAQA